MIADLKPYPAMKDSGVEWLGEVPVHWEVRRLKQTFCRIVGGSTPSSTETNNWDGEVVWVTPADISKTVHLKSSLRRITQDGLRSCSSELVSPGSIIVTSRAPVGNVAIAETDLCTNQGCKALVATPNIVNPLFGLNVLSMLKDELQSLAVGTTFAEISTSRIGSVAIPLPPLPEQTAIVRYLDYMDRRVRRLVGAKRKLITLLTEQKQAIIHHAVTRGLDPDVSLKDSGIEWLGEVPEHWEVRRLKSIAHIRYGLGQPPRESSVGLPLIRATNVERGSIIEKNLVRVDPEDVPASRNAFLSEGEIIVVRSGAYTADSAIIPGEYDGAVAGYDMVVTVNNALPHFIAQSLLSTYVLNDQLIIASMRSAQPHLNVEELGVAQILIPPISEQAVIIERLDHATSNIDNAIARANREIELLNEYRTRLIADVVTGKLDVREVAAALPEVDHLDIEDNLDAVEIDTEVDLAAIDTIPEEIEI